MGKRNKVRYVAKPKDRKTLVLTGKVFLKHEDDEADIDLAVKGDLLCYPCNELENIIVDTGYQVRNLSGYFKVDVFEGNVWCLMLVNDIFPENEHHFSKTEYPLDTFNLIGEMLVALEGRTVERTYREHYFLLEEGEQSTNEKNAPEKKAPRRKPRNPK